MGTYHGPTNGTMGVQNVEANIFAMAATGQCPQYSQYKYIRTNEDM